MAHPTGEPFYVKKPYHLGQNIAADAESRFVAIIAGTKGGKTSFGPWEVFEWILKYGGGDYYAVTSTYDLFSIKMLPALRQVFENILGIARYWSSRRILEICDLETGQFLAKKQDDLMYARIILRAAESRGGLEAGDAKGIWMDEAGQDVFTSQIYRALRRRAALYQSPFLLTTTLYDIGWIDADIIRKVKSASDSHIRIEHVGEYEIEVTSSKKADITLIQYDSPINPSYPKQEYIFARDELPDEDFQSFHRGRRGSSRLLIYDSFIESEQTCTRFKIPSHWPRFWGIDFGPAHMAVVKYAEDPKSAPKAKDRQLYCYENYLAGGKTIEQHVEDMTEEDISPKLVVGGTWGSEEQWRREFRQWGLPIEKPKVQEVDTGIRSVYAQHKKGKITYFDDLPIVLDKARYRFKRDRLGNITDEIQHKRTFHTMDGERYIICTIRPSKGKKGAKTVAW